MTLLYVLVHDKAKPSVVWHEGYAHSLRTTQGHVEVKWKTQYYSSRPPVEGGLSSSSLAHVDVVVRSADEVQEDQMYTQLSGPLE